MGDNCTPQTLSPLKLWAPIHKDAINGDTELWLTDTRAFPDSGSIILNPNCGSSCNEEEI